MNADDLHTQEGRLEDGLRAAEPLVSNGDDLSVGQLVGLLERRRGLGDVHLVLEVESDVAELFLDVADDLALGGGDHGVASLGHDLHEVVSQVASGQVETQDGVGEGVTLVDGDGMGNAIADVEDEAGGTTGSVQGKHGLDAHVRGGGVEGLEDDLDELLAVGLGVERGLGVEMRRLVGGDSQLVVEGMVPDLLHVIPGSDDTVLDRVLQGEDTSLGLSLVTDVGVLVAHADHDGDMAGTTNDGGEDGTGSVISRETALDHAGAIVNDQSGGFLVVTHDGAAESKSKINKRLTGVTPTG